MPESWLRARDEGRAVEQGGPRAPRCAVARSLTAAAAGVPDTPRLLLSLVFWPLGWLQVLQAQVRSAAPTGGGAAGGPKGQDDEGALVRELSAGAAAASGPAATGQDGDGAQVGGPD